jgi:hypothetical protein
MNRSKKPRTKVTRNLTVRAATPKDARALAHLAASVNVGSLGPAMLKRDVFARSPALKVVVAVLDQALVAAAFYVPTYDVPTARRGLFINRFLFSDVARARGVGPVLAAALAALARKQKAAFLHWGSEAWAVDDHDYYRLMGAADVPILAHAIDGPKFAELAKTGAGFLKTR